MAVKTSETWVILGCTFKISAPQSNCRISLTGSPVSLHLAGRPVALWQIKLIDKRSKCQFWNDWMTEISIKLSHHLLHGSQAEKSSSGVLVSHHKVKIYKQLYHHLRKVEILLYFLFLPLLVIGRGSWCGGGAVLESVQDRSDPPWSSPLVHSTHALPGPRLLGQI